MKNDTLAIQASKILAKADHVRKAASDAENRKKTPAPIMCEKIEHPEADKPLTRHEFSLLTPEQRSRYAMRGELPPEDVEELTRSEFNALNPAKRLAYAQSGRRIK